MADLPEGTRIATREVYSGRLLKVDVETVRNPAGQTLELEVVRHPGAAAIVPFLSELDAPDPQILLLRQYRYAAGGVLWEIPAGVLEPGEDPQDCARRELREETGATAQEIRFLTSVFTTPGFTDERIHLFLATGLSVADQHLETDELIEVATRPLSAVLEMIKDGEIADSKTIVAVLYVAGFVLGR
ncbi:MAG: NUDIX hydrolase [Gemmatimonadetes bacterium]|nr:NUDIX hydrolase [Gemmatimonadota bacterium]